MQKLQIPRFIIKKKKSQFLQYFGQRHSFGEFKRYQPLRGGQYMDRAPGARRLISNPSPITSCHETYSKWRTFLRLQFSHV